MEVVENKVKVLVDKITKTISSAEGKMLAGEVVFVEMFVNMRWKSQWDLKKAPPPVASLAIFLPAVHLDPGSQAQSCPLWSPPGHHLGGTRCSRMRVTVALEASLVHEVADNAAIVFATSLRSDGTASTRE